MEVGWGGPGGSLDGSRASLGVLGVTEGGYGSPEWSFVGGGGPGGLMGSANSWQEEEGISGS